MTTAAECLALANKLVAAPEGSRELDIKVLLASGWTRFMKQGLVPHFASDIEKHKRGELADIFYDYCSPEGPRNNMAIGYTPHPTTSLDDWKRWCVPEGYFGTVCTDGSAAVWKRADPVRVHIIAATPELAACAASLRAMAERMEMQDATND